jgi:vesicle coat complex subunit
MLIMVSIIRAGQSNFVSVPIDEDSNERIMNCIQTLSELEQKGIIHDIFLRDTQAAYTKMLGAKEVCHLLTMRPHVADVIMESPGKSSREERSRCTSSCCCPSR